jgi:cell division protein FtsB
MKVAVRRFQLRFLRRRPIWWTAFLVYLGFLAFSSVFSGRGLLTAYRLWSEKWRLDREISRTRHEVNDLQGRMRDFRSDPRAIERYAREELRLVGNNEIQYIFQ